MQLVIGITLAAAFLLVQVQAQPFINMSDDLFSSSLGFCTVIIFLCAYAFKNAALTGLASIQDKMSLEQRTLYVIDQGLLTAISFITVIGAIIVGGCIFVVQFLAEVARLKREALKDRRRRLRYVSTGKEVEVPALTDGEFHLFLSHVWGSGQDQMRVVKQRLVEMLPTSKNFLDVDDLDEGKGAEFVDRSATTLVFISTGYFTSPNCVRELFRAVAFDRPLFSLMESEAGKGGLTREQVWETLLENDASGFYAKCGLASEVDAWGVRLPSAQELYDALFKTEPIEWARIGSFQDVSMRLIANHIVQKASSETFLQGELSRNVPIIGLPSALNAFHVFCSEANEGAAALVQEVSQTLSLKISMTADLEQLPSCDGMLVYLTARTWTSGHHSAEFADHVKLAMKGSVPLLLAHEMPSIDPEDNARRHAVNFPAFFSCVEGTTPRELLSKGIYDQIAIALKDGPWRRASLVLVAHAIALQSQAGESSVNAMTEIMI
uniref:TIR domain-containing protein n=1 Tax=Prymnesium polylepis TaxID=72548 RepID=A0A7S4JF41_9EUKA